MTTVDELVAILDGCIKYAPMLADHPDWTPDQCMAVAQPAHTTAISALRTELQRSRYAGKTGAEIQALLTTEEVVTTSVTRPKTLTAPMLIAHLTEPASIKALAGWPHLTDFRDKMEAQDRAAIATYSGILLVAGYVTQAEFNAVMADVQATEQVNATTTLPAPIVRCWAGIPYCRNLPTLSNIAEAQQ